MLSSESGKSTRNKVDSRRGMLANASLTRYETLFMFIEKFFVWDLVSIILDISSPRNSVPLKLSTQKIRKLEMDEVTGVPTEPVFWPSLLQGCTFSFLPKDLQESLGLIYIIPQLYSQRQLIQPISHALNMRQRSNLVRRMCNPHPLRNDIKQRRRSPPHRVIHAFYHSRNSKR